jgi:hypothetical protein
MRSENSRLQVVRYGHQNAAYRQATASNLDLRSGCNWGTLAERADTRQCRKDKNGSGVHRSDFWSFQPVKVQSPPAVSTNASVKSPIDNFILAKLQKEGLTAASQAGKLTLLRRATFDLIGLPKRGDP